MLILVGWHEKGHSGVCCSVPELSTSQDRTSKAWWIITGDRDPTWKWEMINMDFISGLPRTQQKYDSIWVIVDRLTKSAHFLHVRTTYLAEDYARLYVREKWDFMGFPCPLYQIEELNLQPTFGDHFRRDWGHRWTLAQHFTLRLMGKLSVLLRH